jgi:hypothetical protein
MAKDFTELAAWQLADELRRLILEITATPTVYALIPLPHVLH